MQIAPSISRSCLRFCYVPVVLTLLALTPALATEPTPLVILKDKSKAEFHAKGYPGFIKIDGTGAKPFGKLSLNNEKGVHVVTGDIKVGVDEFDTENDMRNEHMKKKYLETDKYPLASLKLNPVQIKLPWAPTKDPKVADFTGLFTLHGVTKPVDGKLTSVSQKDGEWHVEASYSIKISEFGIALPSFSKITMAEDVLVVVNLVATAQKAMAHGR